MINIFKLIKVKESPGRKHKRILKVIAFVKKVVPNAEYRFTKGLCFKFYILLNIFFSEGEPYHDSDHVVTKIGDKYYDITGEVDGSRYTHMKVDSMYRTEWDRFSREV